MQTIILTHGALGSMADLEKLKQTLMNEGFNVLSFSFSGHGKVNFENNFGIQQFSVELENFILNNNLIKPSVIGYSMGGYVALYLALRSSTLINKIITLGTKFNWAKEVVDKETRMLLPEVMLEKVPAFAKNLEAKHGNAWKELLLRTVQMMQDIGNNNYLNAEALKTIQTKILVGLGDNDQMVTLEETINVYKNLPNSNMYILPVTKHPIETLNIPVFTSIVKDFLNEG